MRLLVIHPNMTTAVTDRVVAGAMRRRRAGTEITGVTAQFGVAIAGLAHRLQPLVPVPLIDGMAAAIGHAEVLAHQRWRPRARHPFVRRIAGDWVERPFGRLLHGEPAASITP